MPKLKDFFNKISGNDRMFRKNYYMLISIKFKMK